MNGFSYVDTTKENATIVVRNYVDNCKQCKGLSNDHSGAFRESNLTTVQST